MTKRRNKKIVFVLYHTMIKGTSSSKILFVIGIPEPY